MMELVGHKLVYTRHHRAVVIAQSAPSDRIRALMLSGISENTANVFVLGNAHRAAVVQLAQRIGLVTA